jgi:hypothetical protein
MISTDLSLERPSVIDTDAAYQEFRRNGYVVFERVLPADLLAEMHAVWAEYFAAFSARRPAARRLIMYLPFKWPLYDSRFIENPLVLQITDRVLGKNYVCGYFASETPLPGAKPQPLHFDLQFFNGWASLNRPLSYANKLLGTFGYAYSIQVTVPLVDSRVENAPLEVWPATNRLTAGPACGPSSILMPAGSILVRDLRLLHRGTTHLGLEPRPFLSIVYSRTWVPKWRAPEIPTDVYNQLPARSRRLFRLARIGHAVPSAQEWALLDR